MISLVTEHSLLSEPNDIIILPITTQEGLQYPGTEEFLKYHPSNREFVSNCQRHNALAVGDLIKGLGEDSNIHFLVIGQRPYPELNFHYLTHAMVAFAPHLRKMKGIVGFAKIAERDEYDAEHLKGMVSGIIWDCEADLRFYL